MKVELVAGDIADQKVDILVNSTTKDLNLSSGPVTKAILKAGGDNLQSECQAACPDGIEFGQICQTSGGNLNCVAVYHTALPQWTDGADQNLRDLITLCLEVADGEGSLSIAFPALGTGNLKYPPETVADAFFSTVSDFDGSSLQLVKIVIYPKDNAVIQAFNDARRNYETQLEISGTLTVNKPSPKRKSSQGGPNTVVIVSLVTSDLTQQQTDVIVNTTNPKLSLKDGLVSKVILEAAGDELQTWCTQSYPSGVKVGDVAVTKGGNLACKHVYHIALSDTWATNQPQTEQEVKDIMLKLMKTADDDGLSSLSMPALGTGKLKYDPTRIAQIMYNAALGFRAKTLNKVVFVVHSSNPDVIQAFEAELSRRRKARQAKKPQCPSLLRTIGQVSSIKIRMVRGSIEDQEVDVLVNSTTPDLNLNSGPLSKAILKGAGTGVQDECKQGYPNGIKGDEIAVTSGGDLGSQGVKQIYHTTLTKWEEGNQDIEKAFRDLIYNCLKTAAQNLQMSIAIPILGTGVLKYPEESAAQWIFQSIQNFGRRNPACTLMEARIVVHPSDVKNIQALCSLEQTVKENTREQLCLPNEWTEMSKDIYCDLIQIMPGCQEYQIVSSQFAQSMGAHTILSIERVQNRHLYFQYMVKKKAIDARLTQQENERHLFHGTSPDAVMSININGFNRNFCGKNATAFGDGVYFALNSSYSAQDLYSRKDASGEKRVYLAKVLTGEFTLGQTGMRNPPPKDPTVPHETFDCLVNNVQNPEIFVIFHDCQAYPSHLITFKC